MNIYRLVFFILIICFIFENFFKKNKKIYSFTKKFGIILICSTMGIRGLMAADDLNYYNAFMEVPTLGNITFSYLKNQVMEPGYILLNSFIKTLGLGFWGVLLLCTTISLINLAKFINFFSISFFYSISFYYARWFFLKEFTQIRNGLASSFFLLSLTQLVQKKIKNFILIILVGSLFHKTILIGLTLPIFQKFYKMKWSRNIILLMIMVFPFLNLKIIMNKILLPIFGTENIYLTGVYSTRTSYMAVYYVYIIFIIIYLMNRVSKIKYKNKFFLESTLGYSVFFNSFLFDFGDLGGRLVSYFNIEYVIEDKFLKIFRQKILIKFSMILFLLLIYKINFINRVERSIIPYKTYFMQMKKNEYFKEKNK